MNKHEISSYIRSQFPTAYEEGGENFVAFVEAYYEFLDKNYFQHKTVLETMDIDNTLEEFISSFKETYLMDFPFVTATNKEFMIKNIKDFYKSKGSELSTKLLLRMMFGDDSSIYTPSDDILKASDSFWYEPEYIEVSRSDRNVTFLNKEIVGSKSKARAIVEGVVTKRVQGKYIDVVYISSSSGKFVTGEYLTDDGNLEGSPKVVGSLTRVFIENGGRDNKVGDIFEIRGAGGENGRVRVASVAGATGRVDFSIEDGGFGFTNTLDTKVYISDGVLFTKNTDLMMEYFDKVSQDIERISLVSYNNISGSISIGSPIVGLNASGNTIARGVVTSFTPTNDDEGRVEVYMTEGTFTSQKKFNFSEDVYDIIEKDVIETESKFDLTVSNPTTTIVVGQRIEQFDELASQPTTGLLGVANSSPFVVGETISQTSANGELVVTAVVSSKANTTSLNLIKIARFASPKTYIENRPVVGLTSSANTLVTSYTDGVSQVAQRNRVYGHVVSVSGTSVSVDRSWGGNFDTSKIASIYSSDGTTSLGTCGILEMSKHDDVFGSAVVSAVSGNTVFVGDIKGSFPDGIRVKSTKSTKFLELVSSDADGATDVYINNNTSLISLISSSEDASASGLVVGQNSSSIGIWGNTAPFISSGDVTVPNTTSTIINLFSDTFDETTVETDDIHGFSVGDVVNISVDLQQNGEIKRIYGIYTVLGVPSLKTFKISIDHESGDIIRVGGMSFFSAFVSKTLYMNAKVHREFKDDFFIQIDSLGTGSGADFDVGEIENEESVFVYSDVIGDKNVAEIPYLEINAEGKNSGQGWVGGVTVNNGGSGYSNGAVISFEGGGYGGGSPYRPAYGYVSTNDSGSIVSVEMTSLGEGYFNDPIMVLPETSGDVADVDVELSYGYGFPMNPIGGFGNALEDFLQIKEMSIGTISSIVNIDPGSEYNVNPFVYAYNSYIAGHGRETVYGLVSTGSSSFVVGERLFQTIEGGGGAISSPKGVVVAIDGDVVYVKRMSFSVSFIQGYPIVGESSGATRILSYLFEVGDKRFLGANATIPAIAISADGIATEVDVIDSGFGYIHNSSVTLFDPNKPFVVSGKTSVESNGVASGSWKSETSHLDKDSRLHDNYYYQEFSYEVSTEKSLKDYKDILKKIVHVSGTKMFGKVSKNNEVSVPVNAKYSSMRSRSSIENAYIKIADTLFKDGSSGDVLWSSGNTFFSDSHGQNEISLVGSKLGSWRSSIRKNNNKRRNLLTWSDNLYEDSWVSQGAVKFKNYIESEYDVSPHGVYQNFNIKAGDNLHFTAKFKSPVSRRVSVVFGGNANNGGVTFDAQNGNVFATSGNYTLSARSVDGWVEVKIRSGFSVPSGGVASVGIYFNSVNGNMKETFVPNGIYGVYVKEIQVEDGVFGLYQNVRHGMEWDGILYSQHELDEYRPSVYRQPINGVKNLLTKSDDFRDVVWEKHNSKMVVGGKILDNDSYIMKDVPNKIPTKHSISRTIVDVDFDNIGFVIKNVDGVRYIKLEVNDSKSAIFDLEDSGFLVSSSFDDAFIEKKNEEDGVFIIGVYDDTISSSGDVDSTVSLSILKDSTPESEYYIGDGEKKLGLMRCYVSKDNQTSVLGAYQKNVSEENVTSMVEEDVWGVRVSSNEQRLIAPKYLNSMVGASASDEIKSYMIIGKNGIWYEEDDINDYLPHDYEIIKALGNDIFGVIVLNRKMTVGEQDFIRNVVRGVNLNYNKFEKNSTNLLNQIGDFNLVHNITIVDNMATLTDTDGIMELKLQPNSLVEIKFNLGNYGMRSMSIHTGDEVDTAKSIDVSENKQKLLLRTRSGNLIFKVSGLVGSAFSMSNIEIKKYDAI